MISAEPTTGERKPTVEDWLRANAFQGLVWLAGYPRAGAALVRTILVHCFGQVTGSIYNERGLGEHYIEAMRMWNLAELGRPGAMKALVARQKMLAVKTHQLPPMPEPIPAIVIVRDARRVFESLRAFYRERNEIDVSMRDIILDKHPWGSWSRWHKSWAAASRFDTLWLRYEWIMEDVPRAVRKIAAHFEGIAPIGYEIPPFETMRAGTPTIFRRAEVSGNGGMTEQEEELFWAVHGGTMEMLGYVREC